jgi:AraC-like DNA-binding protein
VPVNQVSEFCACGLVQSIRWLVGSDWNPDAVCQEHPRPAHTSAQSNFLRCELRYDQVMGGILLGRDALNLKVITSPAVLRRHAKTLIENTLTGSTAHFEVQVARVITQSLRDSSFDADSIASSLGMNRRTLHRRLTSQGLSYSTLLQQVRYETARRLVEVGTVPLTDVAEATGFSSQSSFSRWFQTTFGCTASEWKRRGGALR